MATFWRNSGDVLRGAVPHYLAPCWFTLDPASLIMTSHFQEGVPEFPAEWAAAEYSDDGDVHHLADVARSVAGVSTRTTPPTVIPKPAHAGTRTWHTAATRS